MTPSIPPSDPTRRTLLKAIVVGLCLVGLGLPGRALARWARTGPGLAERLTTLARRGALWPLGEAYLRAHPEERDVDVLLQGLAQAGVRESGGDGPAGGRLRRALASAARADFVAGDTVDVDGWLLSRTEARACAVACLHRARHPFSAFLSGASARK